ncbi:hypothetical protein ACLB1E_34225 [Escherichia coli]
MLHKQQAAGKVTYGIFINRVYSKDSQSLCGKLRYDLSNGLASGAFAFLFPFRLVWGIPWYSSVTTGQLR